VTPTTRPSPVPQDQPAAQVLTIRREITRKGLHLLSTIVPVAYATGLRRSIVIWMLAVALTVAIVVELARIRNARARAVFDARLGALLREHEWHGPSGATWLALALLLAAVAFPRDVAVAAMCAVALGDAAAAIVGRSLSRHGGGRKSFSGSAACFVASTATAYAVAQFTWPEALLAGILAALAERPRRPLDDNLRVAIAVGCGILLWRMGFS
jgi:dolichol kinase